MLPLVARLLMPPGIFQSPVLSGSQIGFDRTIKFSNTSEVTTLPSLFRSLSNWRFLNFLGKGSRALRPHPVDLSIRLGISDKQISTVIPDEISNLLQTTVNSVAGAGLKYKSTTQYGVKAVMKAHCDQWVGFTRKSDLDLIGPRVMGYNKDNFCDSKLRA
jgi:hypothetical protein